MLGRLTNRLPRLTLVVSLLVLTLGVAAALAWQAHQAARSHEEAARRVQFDYVAFAGWQLARSAKVELSQRFDKWLSVIGCGAVEGRLPSPSGLATGPGCKCDDLAARTLFHIDVRTGDLKTTGEPLGAEARQWILGLTTGARRIPPSHRGHVLEVAHFDDAPLAIASGAGAASRVALGTTVMAGMIAATFFGVYLIPVLYFAIQSLVNRFSGTKTHAPEPGPPIMPGPDAHRGVAAHGD